MFGKNGIDYVFFGYSLYSLFAVLFILTILEKTSGVAAAMKGFNGNLLKVTPFFSISFRDYLFMDAPSHS